MTRSETNPSHRLALAGLLSGLAMATIPSIIQAQILKLQGLTGPTVELSADEIRAMPHKTVNATVHGLSGAYSGVPLGLLMAKVNAPLGQSLRGPAMGDVVIAVACDGYRVALTLPDIDPAFRDSVVILADSVNGHALDTGEGPYRLVVEGDKRAARSARCVSSLTVTPAP